MTLSIVIYSALASIFGVSLVVGLCSGNRDRKEHDAATTWRNIEHRNGVTAPIPFAAPSAPVNAPGLVRVYPKTQQPDKQQLSLVGVPASTPSPQVQPQRPAPVSVMERPDEAVSSASAGVQLPMKLAEAASDEEREAVLKLHGEGKSMTAVIFAVWGAKSGGSKKYAYSRDFGNGDVCFGTPFSNEVMRLPRQVIKTSCHDTSQT
ncbi:MAG: hypothetical protein AAF810_22790 [Cyanobacteria bacterium P01_D01_bin.36]